MTTFIITVAGGLCAVSVVLWAIAELVFPLIDRDERPRRGL